MFQDKILEKPQSTEHAVDMLASMSNEAHEVMTAVSLFTYKNGKITSIDFVESTFVEFDNLSRELIEDYVSTGEPMDKAGGYGYQGLAAFFIKKINGCYYNVVGFPAQKFFEHLLKLSS